MRELQGGYMKKVILLSFIILAIATGCSNESMIQIDSSRQASIDAKLAEQTGSPEESNSNETMTTSPAKQIARINFENVPHLAEGTVLEITNYLPSYPNQLKYFSSGDQEYATYVDFINEASAMFQVSEHFDGATNVKTFQLNGGAITQISSYENVGIIENVLNGTSQATTSLPRVLLQEPIALGTTWIAYDTIQSSITALYESVPIGNQTYTNVVEVTTDYEAYSLKEYYAAQEGLVLTWIVPILENVTEQQWQLVDNYRNVKFADTIALAVPNTNTSPLLTTEEGVISHQTGESLETAFTALFNQKGWLAQVVIQHISLDANQVLTVDFTPGIVAAMNAQPAQEEGILPAIVQTFANYYGVKQVKLTVNGAILLPDRLTLPSEGIWQVEDSWLQAAQQ